MDEMKDPLVLKAGERDASRGMETSLCLRKRNSNKEKSPVIFCCQCAREFICTLASQRWPVLLLA
jgi:hypothetical protein